MRFLAVAAALFLAGCAHVSGTAAVNTDVSLIKNAPPPAAIVVSKPTLIRPPESLLVCPAPPALPLADTLKDSQVAEVLEETYTNNRVCYNNAQALEKFYEDAVRQLEQVH